MTTIMKKFTIALLLLTGVTLQAQAKNAMHIVINNHLGAPEILVDENQKVVWQAEYDEFGEANIIVEDIEFNARFPGQYYDKESGLHYNYYRDYDSSLGRYVQSDPIGLAGGINTYGYVGGNPVSYVDSLGLTQEQIDDAIKFVKFNNPDLNFPKNCKVKDLGFAKNGNEIAGQTSIYTWPREIRLDDRYLVELDENGMQQLLTTIIHEALHYNESRNESFKNRDHHEPIYTEAKYRADQQKEQYKKDVISKNNK